MQERTLAPVSSVLALIVVFVMGLFRVKTPHNIPFFVIYAVSLPVLMVPLKVVNKSFVTWRNGRRRGS